MTFKGQYKLDDGTNVVMDCFPVRKIFKGGYQSAGHWVEAQKSPKQKDFQAVLGPKPPTQRVFAAPSPTSKPHVAQIPKSAKEKVLDGNYLMLLHCVDNQSDLCVANISDQDLNAVNEEDFHLFDSVAFINAAVNHLPFEPFRLFPALRDLDLSANGLQNLLVISQDFPHLEVLNLSYNNVSKEDILALGILPQLKVLHLTGNDLDSLPPDLTAPYDPVDRLEEPFLRFPVLEVLMLDENRLSDPCVFSSLASLHRLKYLNLDQNNFTGVPYLQQMETSAPFEKTESAQLCHSIISQIKQPIKCPSAPSVEISVFQSDVEAQGQLRERVLTESRRP
ncbi:X-ray radiation resistance-associated protein 1-like [Pristis pectinata]|uniref:X-ray radiation resistance-associated protein 1-like n=1 Tax=Pristis pectinata TaxID=685728 RepID=UPI00223E305D|nr:X-ray radiation resistance-associated protein 1-like [Pristis pectinata]